MVASQGYLLWCVLTVGGWDLDGLPPFSVVSKIILMWVIGHTDAAREGAVFGVTPDMHVAPVPAPMWHLVLRTGLSFADKWTEPLSDFASNVGRVAGILGPWNAFEGRLRSPWFYVALALECIYYRVTIRARE